jgi:hypothetical protein
MGDVCLWDELFTWALHHCPALLDDEPLFAQLHDLVHRLLVETARRESRAAVRRALQPSRS